MTGAERVLAEMLRCFPGADVFAAFDFLPAEHRHLLGGARVHTSFVQRLPRARTRYWDYIPLMPLAMEQFDLEPYDLVVSNSHTVAKGVLVHPHQGHLAYVNSPPRFAWDLQAAYLRDFRLERGLKSWLARIVFARMRQWDFTTAARADVLLANSSFIARRMEVCYRRSSEVLHPPVDVAYHAPDVPDPDAAREDFYLAASRLTPFKRLDLVVEAFAAMPERRLVVIGDGPERDRLRRLARPNVTLLGWQSDDVLRAHMRRARALVFPAPEDFGLVMAEAQACGTPVIALGRGGARDIVRGLDDDAPTGAFFADQTPESVRGAVERFEAERGRVTWRACRESAMRFAPERFRAGLLAHANALAARLGLGR